MLEVCGVSVIMVHHNNGTGSADLWLEIGAKFSVLASVLVIIYFFVATTYRIARYVTRDFLVACTDCSLLINS